MKKNLILILLLSLTAISVNAQTQLTNLPTVYVTTDDGRDPASKEIYQTGKVTIKSSEASEELTDVKTDVRGRGNSTWGFAKKPYRLKLDKKASLLGLPAKAKKWCLLANHADKTLIRNAVGLKISEMLGFEFTPAYRFVDLVLNGRYAGNYLLTDQVEVASNRVPAGDDGFLLEVDFRYAQEPVYFTTKKNIGIVVKYPDEDADGNDIDPADPRVTYIRGFTQQFEDALFSTGFKNPTTGYRALVDEKSLVNWYLAMELVGDHDAWQTGYLYKYKDVDKLYFGPLWDFDISFNNNNVINATYKMMRETMTNYNTWVKRLWEDEWFRAAVNSRWKQLVDDQHLVEVLINHIRTTAQEIDESQQRNFQTWPVLTTKIFYEQYLFPTYEQGVDFLVDYIEKRTEFLTDAFAGNSLVFYGPKVIVTGKMINTGLMNSTIPLFLKAKDSGDTVFNNNGTVNIKAMDVGATTLLYNSGTLNVTGQ